MTVTKRKQTGLQPESRSTDSAAAGVTYSCDACSADISHTLKIRCAQQHSISTTINGQPVSQLALVCENFDLCGQCFCEGKEVGRHKAWHDYRLVEQHTIPIFTEDWGADEELLLIDACQTYGLGNWSDIAEHVGNGRTKEEVERHYLDVFIGSDDYPLPPMDVRIDMDQDEFQARKKRRLEEVQARPLQPPPPKPSASAPTNHEIAGFMPGRLDFETEWENEAESSIKDLSFGRVYRFGGDSQPATAAVVEEEEDGGVGMDQQEEQEEDQDEGTERRKQRGLGSGAGKVTQRKDEQSARANLPLETLDEALETDPKDGPRASSADPLQLVANPTTQKVKGKEKEDKKPSVQEDAESEVEPPMLDEHDEDLELKLTMVDIYNDRYDRRLQAKAVIFDRNLLEYKKIQATERKMPKEIRDLVIRIKPFARLQTALDHEKFQAGLIYEMGLRKRIAELQEYRRMGITTLAEADRYEKEKSARLAAKQREFINMERFGARKQRASGAGLMHEEMTGGSREGTPGGSGKAYKRLSPLPLSLATAASQALLHPSELALCSRLRILPRPLLYIKHLLFREHVRRAAAGGTLGRADVAKLLPLEEAVEEDALELGEAGPAGGEEQNAGHGAGCGVEVKEEGDCQRGKKMEGKMELIWEFYFGGQVDGCGGISGGGQGVWEAGNPSGAGLGRVGEESRNGGGGRGGEGTGGNLVQQQKV